MSDLPRTSLAAPPAAPVSRPTPRSRFSPIWIVPLVSAVLGLWLVWRHYSAKGPEVVVRFETAEGIISGKTPVLCRSVSIGVVSDVKLAPGNNGVVVTLALTRQAARLLMEDTQIWVVRARYSSAGISGLNTLISGNYIELQPGVSGKARGDFIGLENPPPTPPGVPGIRFKLVAEQAGGLGPGASIIYKGIVIGKLETRDFHPETGEVEFSAFIEAQYASLVNAQTRFYNFGGLDFKMGAEGVQLRTGTIESLLTSAVTFTEPDFKDPAPKGTANGHTFVLFGSFDATRKADFNPSLPYLLLFSGTVRGLTPDAPVELRGIRVGSVVAASFKYMPDDPEHRVPVLIKVDPNILTAGRDASPEAAQLFMSENVKNGLRATLKIGNLLTGQLFVDLDFQKDAAPAEIADNGGYQLLPTVDSSNLEQLEEKIGGLVDKFKALPVETTIANANGALASVKDTAANLTKLTGKDSPLDQTLRNTQKLTAELSSNRDIATSLQNLRIATEEIKTVGQNLSQASDTVKRQPWRLIWPSTKKYDDKTPAATPPPAKASPRKIPARRPKARVD